MRCKNCGSENEDNLYICQNCGSPLYDEDEPVENNDENEMDRTKVVPVIQTPSSTSVQPPKQPQKPPVDEDEEKKKKQQIAIIVTLAVVLVVIVGVLIGVVVKNNSNKETTTESTSVSQTTSTTDSYTTERTTRPTTTAATTTESTTVTTTEAAKFNVEVICPDGGGTVRGGGNFAVNSECKVIATADPEFEFDGWYENGNRVSRSPEYTFTVVKNQKLVAKFTEVTQNSGENNE